MIDIDTYKTLHPESDLVRLPPYRDIDAEMMARDEPPGSESLLVFPALIKGFNLRTKKWRQYCIISSLLPFQPLTVHYRRPPGRPDLDYQLEQACL